MATPNQLINVSKLYQQQQQQKQTVATPPPAVNTARVKDQTPTPASTFTYGLGNPAVTQVTKPAQTLPTTTAKPATTTTSKTTTPTVTTSPAQPMGGVARGEYTAAELGTATGAGGGPTARTLVRSEYIGSGKSRIQRNYYSDGTQEDVPAPEAEADTSATTVTTNVDVIKSILKGFGYPQSLIASSVDFFNALAADGLSADDIVEIYLNNPSYTTKSGKTVSSAFYTSYGKFNEGLAIPYTPKELFNTVEGYKAAKDKFALNDKFISEDYIKQYLKNGVSVARFEDNANRARLQSLTADINTVATLRDLGYISTAQDLTDFYMDPTVGIEKMQQNYNTLAFGVEAKRRATSGIAFNAQQIKELGAYLTSQGMSEQTISALASKGYSEIANILQPLTRLEGIYGTQAMTEQKTQESIQQQLEAEQFKGMESELRKRRTEQNVRAFQGAPGTTSISLSSGILAGLL